MRRWDALLEGKQEGEQRGSEAQLPRPRSYTDAALDQPLGTQSIVGPPTSGRAAAALRCRHLCRCRCSLLSPQAARLGWHGSAPSVHSSTPSFLQPRVGLLALLEHDYRAVHGNNLAVSVDRRCAFAHSWKRRPPTFATGNEAERPACPASGTAASPTCQVRLRLLLKFHQPRCRGGPQAHGNHVLPGAPHQRVLLRGTVCSGGGGRVGGVWSESSAQPRLAWPAPCVTCYPPLAL